LRLAEPGQHAEQAAHAAHLAHLLQLARQILEVEPAAQGMYQPPLT
jgi:hypothetical protein